jgi:ankyrin repeat protein
MHGHVEATKLLLAKRANVHAKSNTGLTAVHCASRYKNPEILQLIIGNGGDPTSEDCRGSSPLHAAAMGGDGEVIEILLKYCDSRKFCDRNGWTPSLVASRSLHNTISQRLQQCGDSLVCHSQIGIKSPTCWSREEKGAALRLTESDRTVEFFGTGILSETCKRDANTSL